MPKLYSAYGLGQSVIPVMPPPIGQENAPNTNMTNYEIGQVVYTPTGAATTFYIYGGAGNWISFADSDGSILAINGTANQITATTVAGTTTLSLPAAITAPGSLTTTTTLASGTSLSAGTTITAGTGITATTGNIVASTGNITSTLGSMSAATTVTAGTGITATTGDIVASTGNITSTLGSVGAATTVTAGTSITATLGNITASNGNFVGSTTGTGLSFPNAGTASGAASGPVVLNARVGEIVFTGVSIAAAADLTLTMTNSAISGATSQIIFSLTGVTTGAALSIKSYTPSAGSVAIVVTNGTGATTSIADITLNFLVLKS